MDTTMLAPRTGGRSRFSKALPLPPPSQETFANTFPSQMIPGGQPAPSATANTTAFPARKSSVGARFAPNPEKLSTPALPPKASEPELQKKMPQIPRKAVASPPPAADLNDTLDVKKLRRVSSISSLLSAYSNTSSDSVPRSSQGSSVTKNSEASLSPEREVVHEEQQDYLSLYKAYTRSPHEEPSAQETKFMMQEPLPPPPPVKDASMPVTPRMGLPATPRNGRPPAALPKEADDSSSQVALTNASPPRREIWRRRASSKSDRSIAVAGLKLAVSHGSTAATTAPLPPNDEGSAQKPAEPATLATSRSVNETGPFPPRSSSALPGRNVKPQPKQSAAVAAEAAQPLAKASPAWKNEPAPPSTLPVKPPADATSPMPLPELPAKSVKRREVGSKPNVPNSRSPEATPAQHLREARSAISLRDNSHERLQREVAEENFSLQDLHHQEAQMQQGMPSARGRRPSNPQAPRLAPAPHFTITSPMGGTAPREPVEYKEQVPIELTPQEQKNLMDAISKVVNRSWDWPKVTPNQQGVWPCKELTSDHITCSSNHGRWLHMENFHNPIACMLCHDGGREHRRVCKTCGVRLCISCSEVLTGRKIAELDFNALAGKTKEKEVAHE